MPDQPEPNKIAESGKSWFPWWRESPPMIKALIVICAAAIALAYLKPWKKEEATHSVGRDEIGGDKAGRDINKNTYNFNMTVPDTNMAKMIPIAATPTNFEQLAGNITWDKQVALATNNDKLPGNITNRSQPSNDGTQFNFKNSPVTATKGSIQTFGQTGGTNVINNFGPQPSIGGWNLSSTNTPTNGLFETKIAMGIWDPTPDCGINVDVPAKVGLVRVSSSVTSSIGFAVFSGHAPAPLWNVTVEVLTTNTVKASDFTLTLVHKGQPQ